MASPRDPTRAARPPAPPQRPARFLQARHERLHRGPVLEVRERRATPQGQCLYTKGDRLVCVGHLARPRDQLPQNAASQRQRRACRVGTRPVPSRWCGHRGASGAARRGSGGGWSRRRRDRLRRPRRPARRARRRTRSRRQRSEHRRSSGPPSSTPVPSSATASTQPSALTRADRERYDRRPIWARESLAKEREPLAKGAVHRRPRRPEAPRRLHEDDTRAQPTHPPQPRSRRHRCPCGLDRRGLSSPPHPRARLSTPTRTPSASAPSVALGKPSAAPSTRSGFPRSTARRGTSSAASLGWPSRSTSRMPRVLRSSLSTTGPASA